MNYLNDIKYAEIEQNINRKADIIATWCFLHINSKDPNKCTCKDCIDNHSCSMDKTPVYCCEHSTIKPEDIEFF